MFPHIFFWNVRITMKEGHISIATFLELYTGYVSIFFGKLVKLTSLKYWANWLILILANRSKVNRNGFYDIDIYLNLNAR